MTDINTQAALAIRERIGPLSELIVKEQYALHGQNWQDFGEAGRAKSMRDIGYHLTYLAGALSAKDQALFSEYIAWVKVLFAGLNFKEDTVPVTLELTRAQMEIALPPELFPVVRDFIDQAIIAFHHAPSSLPSYLPETADNLSRSTRRYVDLLLMGERQLAASLIHDLVLDNVPVRDIYLKIFQPAQREIGRMWQTNQISVAKEHYCTAATQMIMSQLYPYVFSTDRLGMSMVVTCVESELHEIGARMVADFFEMAGWDTYFLGANTPAKGIIHTLDERNANLLAISATMSFHVDKVVELIRDVRASNHSQKVKIIVGGYPFNLSPNLWKTVGADGYAIDAQQAVQMAESFFR
jgi:methanogenic corrinoid protein MtbC1